MKKLNCTGKEKCENEKGSLNKEWIEKRTGKKRKAKYRIVQFFPYPIFY